MKNILFVANVSLSDPKRGTPLRIFNFLKQVKKENNLYIIAKDISDDFISNFVQYPKLNFLKKLFFFKKIVSDNKIDIIITATETGIKLPILLKFFCHVKIAIDIHGLYFEELYFAGRINWLTKVYNEFLVKVYLRFYDLIFVVSKKLNQFYNKVNDNIVVLYGGVNLLDFSSQPQLGGNRNEIIIGYMGNSRAYQGLGELLDVAGNIQKKKIFPFKLNLVISGDINDVEKTIREKNLTTVTSISSNISHDKVDAIINKSDVLILSRPSLKMTEYAYPSKLPEYLATGILTITTNVGPVAELFSNRDVCLVIEPDKIVENLEEALKLVFNLGQSRRLEIGRNAVEFIKNNLTWDVLSIKINSSLEKI